MKTSLKVALLLSLLLVSAAQATQPYPFVQWIEMASSEEVSLFVLPDGSGPPLTSAQILGGQTVDATITVALISEDYVPIINFPYEDIWLDAESEQQFSCILGFCADHSTDSSGQTTFSTSLAGGGWSEGPIYVYVVGNPAYDPTDYPWYWAHPPVALRFNSADISGNGIVDLTDVGLFAGDFFGTYQYRSDFYWDGVLNLPDVGRMANGLGISCP